MMNATWRGRGPVASTAAVAARAARRAADAARERREGGAWGVDVTIVGKEKTGQVEQRARATRECGAQQTM